MSAIRLTLRLYATVAPDVAQRDPAFFECPPDE